MAKRIQYQDINKTINEVLLHQELTQALGDVLVGIQITKDKTRIALLSPTEEDLKKLAQIVETHDAKKLTTAQSEFQAMTGLIQETVGKKVTDLSTPERWALLAGLLYQAKALTSDMTIRDPQVWIAYEEGRDD